ncbi:MAG: glycosyltransferase family 4 protein [Desulfobacterales bacterium]|nr:glycosyltransferase family 4 protein [Desulfobacterales bacterium]
MKKVSWPISFLMNHPDKPYNILHLIDTTGHGGAETVFKTLVCGLDKTRFKSYVLLSDYGWLFDQLSAEPGVRVFVFNGKGRLNFSLLQKIVKFIREYQIDLVHTHLFGSSFYGSVATCITRTPVISTFHGIPDWRPEDLFNKIKLSIIFVRTKAVVFVSEYLKNYFSAMAYTRPGKSICIYNGIPMPKVWQFDRRQAKKELGFSESDILISAVGNIKPIKGYDVLLRAAESVISKFPDVKFVVAGAPVDETYQILLNLRAELKLDNSFFFIGYQGKTDIVYKASDLFVLPSLSEGFSLSVIEAMSHKIPVVATKSGGPEEILENDITGKLVAPGSSAELAQGIIEVLENPSFQKNISENGFRVFLNKFSETGMIQQYQELYDSSINRSL